MEKKISKKFSVIKWRGELLTLSYRQLRKNDGFFL